jgi:hypothetical protein
LLKLGVPHDVYIANDAFLDGDRPPTAAAESIRQARSDTASTVAIDGTVERDLRRRWREISRTAKHVIAPSEQAQICALKFFRASRLSRVKAAANAGGRKIRRRGQAISRLGFLPIQACSEEQALMGATARAIRLTNPGVMVTVLGSTLDDLGLMQIANTFVTGSIDPQEVESLAKSYDLQAVFVPLTRRIFGHPLVDSVSTSALPVAYFDWSLGRLRARSGDLAFDPRVPFEGMVARLRRWLSQS